MKNGLVLIGGGGHCKSCIDVIEQEDCFHIIGIVDRADKVGQRVLGYPIFATDDELAVIAEKYSYFLITLGQIKSPTKRIEKFEQIQKLNANLPVVVSPESYVSRHAIIGEGTIVMHGAVINAGVKIGVNCIINTRAIIEHDVIIEDHCHVSTGAVVNGGCMVKRGSFLGSGSITKEYITIKENSFIKANSLVGTSDE